MEVLDEYDIVYICINLRLKNYLDRQKHLFWCCDVTNDDTIYVSYRRYERNVIKQYNSSWKNMIAYFVLEDDFNDLKCFDSTKEKWRASISVSDVIASVLTNYFQNVCAVLFWRIIEDENMIIRGFSTGSTICDHWLSVVITVTMIAMFFVNVFALIRSLYSQVSSSYGKSLYLSNDQVR